MEKYTAKYLAQRATGIAMLPVVLWFSWVVAKIIAEGSTYYCSFLAQPLNVLLAILFIIMFIFHADLGIRSICDDYIRSKRSKLIIVGVLQLIKLSTIIAGVFAIISLHIVWRVS